MTVIRLDHVTKEYPRHRHLTRGLKQSLLHLPDLIRSMSTNRFFALDDISLEVRQGEAVGIIGANGSGKSTLLGLIAGVIGPQAGTVEVHGRVAPLLELGAGFHYELTGYENIVLNGVLMGLTRRQVAARLEAIVAFSGLESSLNEPLRTYSPDILLIDEILAVGDTHFQARCHERLEDFRRQGTTFVIVSHGLAEIRLLCDRVVWLAGGKIMLQGKPDEVIAEYEKS